MVPTIKSIRPGKLRGMRDSQIAASLGALFEAPVDVDDGVVRIYCVSQYDDADRLMRDCARLTNVGHVSVASQGGEVFVKLVFNQTALNVIRQTASEKQIQ